MKRLLPALLLVALTLGLAPMPLAAQGRTLDLGMSQVPQNMWTGQVFTVSLGGIAPKYLKAQLKTASDRGFGIFLVIPRQYLTATGQVGDAFSVDAAKHAIELYRAALAPTEWAGYIANGTLRGLNLGDDYGCLPCWGGRGISQTAIDQVGQYARIRLGPALPLGLRVPAAWLGAYRFGWLDYVWAQGRTAMWKKITFQQWYDRQAADAQALGLKIVGGLNVTDADLAGVPRAATATELQTELGYLIPNRAYCGVVSWRYDQAVQEATRHAAWVSLSSQARQQASRSCKRGTP